MRQASTALLRQALNAEAGTSVLHTTRATVKYAGHAATNSTSRVRVPTLPVAAFTGNPLTVAGAPSAGALTSYPGTAASHVPLEYATPVTFAPSPRASAASPTTLDGSAPGAVERGVDRKLITQLLGHFKKTAEVRQYLKYYGSVDSDRFAIVKISGDLLHNEAETQRAAASLAFLHRMGLVPIVVHGAGLFTGRRSAEVTAAAKALPGESVSARRQRLLAAGRDYMLAANATLIEALRKEGVDATSLSGSVFTATRDTSACGTLSGVTGLIQRVDVDAISAAVEAGRIPVVASLSAVSFGSDEHVTFSTQDATLALAKVVKPLKIIWLRPEGGLTTTAGAPVPAVDLSGPTSTAMSLPAEDQWCLDQLTELYTNAVAYGEAGASVSVTKPEHLAAELFTHKGCGTVVYRGERVHEYDSLEGLDLTRIGALVEDAFGAPLPSDFFAKLTSGTAQRKLRRMYVSEGYRAVAIVTEEDGLPGVPYLDKFAVSPSAQGDKLGEVLWKQMVGREEGLYWRSRSSNRVNPWYYEQSTGCFKNKGGDWTVFWRGLDDSLIMSAVNTALALPATFAPRVYPAPLAGSKPPPQQPVLK